MATRLNIVEATRLNIVGHRAEEREGLGTNQGPERFNAKGPHRSNYPDEAVERALQSRAQSWQVKIVHNAGLAKFHMVCSWLMCWRDSNQHDMTVTYLASSRPWAVGILHDEFHSHTSCMPQQVSNSRNSGVPSTERHTMSGELGCITKARHTPNAHLHDESVTRA